MAKEEFRILNIPYDFIDIEKLGKTALCLQGGGEGTLVIPISQVAGDGSLATNMQVASDS